MFYAMFYVTVIQAQNNTSQDDNTNRFERENLNIRLGPEAGFPLGKMNNTQALGIGASALVDIPVARRFSIIGYVGYISFAGDKMPSSTNKYSRTSVVPLRAGINYKLSPNFYATAQLGQTPAARTFPCSISRCTASKVSLTGVELSGQWIW